MLQKILISITVIFVCVWSATSVALAAPTTVSSDVTADSTWTIENSPYLVQGLVTIDSGVVLTIEPGVVVKFSSSGVLRTEGVLIANGSNSSPIYFTSERDDSVGGDSNNNGTSTTPDAADWSGIRVQPGGEANFDYVEVRYAGYYRLNNVKSHPAVTNFGGTLTVNNSVITNNRLYGIGQTAGNLHVFDTQIEDHKHGIVVLGGDVVIGGSTFEDSLSRGFLSQTTGAVSLLNNNFRNNSFAADIDISNLSGLTTQGNQAEGGGSNGIVLRGEVTNELTLSPDDIPYIVSSGGGLDAAGVFIIGTVSGLDVATGGSLAFEAGSVIKFGGTGASLSVDGTLVTNGTLDNQVYFTSLKDDGVGGDTDESAVQPARSDWQNVVFNDGSQVDFQHTNVRYAGHSLHGNGSQAGILNNGGDFYMFGGSLAHNNRYGLLHKGGHTTITESRIFDNPTYGILNDTMVDVRAENNYWGDPTGPLHLTLNTDGLGNRVSNYVLFEPWCETEDCKTEPDIDPLLLQYAPILYFHEDEDYFPMNVEAFIEDSALWSTDGFNDTPLKTEEELTVAEFESIIESGVDTSDYYLAYSDPEKDKSIDLEAAKFKYDASVLDGHATTTVYVHKMTDGYTDSFGNTHSFIVLQYWFFYAMNNWLEHDGFNNHEGDWESVFIFLDEDTEEPEYVAYSAHLNDGEDNFFTQYDSVRRKWDEVEMSNESVRSYVALGSHANYSKNNNGEHLVPGIFEDNFDETSVDGQIFNFSSEFSQKLISTSAPIWISDYKGKWGADTTGSGFDGPFGPNFLSPILGGNVNRFQYPTEWAGIDKFEQVEIEEPTNFLDFLDGLVSMSFSELLEEGSVISSDQHDELVTFGENLVNIDFLPHFWDFESNLADALPTTTVTFMYNPAELVDFNIIENDLSVYFFNEETNEWESQPSLLDTAANTISFITSHFSRYAIGASKWDTLTDGFEIKKRWGKYDPDTGIRQAGVGIKGDVSGDVRLLITDITAAGVHLINNTGTTTNGTPFIDITVIKDKPFDAELEFSIPAKDVESNDKNSKSTPSTLNFDYRVEVQKVL